MNQEDRGFGVLGFGVPDKDQRSRAQVQMVRMAVSFFIIKLFYVYECLLSCLSVHSVCTWCLWRPEEGTSFLGIEVTDSYACWDSNPDSLEK